MLYMYIYIYRERETCDEVFAFRTGRAKRVLREEYNRTRAVSLSLSLSLRSSSQIRLDRVLITFISLINELTQKIKSTISEEILI